MDVPPSSSGGGSSGGGGVGPAPFLLKTYDMIDDSSTDEIVSWSSSNNSFVVWNPPEFARLLLPTYFKHNNFSSFIRQLNTYGFRKIDPERWEFANEEFVKDQKHLLKNIHRRKPVHSHSNPQGSSVDPERAAFDEEIDKLLREKAVLEANILSSKQQCSVEKLQLEDLTQRLGGLEQRQNNLLTFLEKSVKNPTFVELLLRKVESMDLSAYHKKRRLPEVEHSQPVIENSFLDNNNSYRSEFGNVFHQVFSNKLRLELSQAVSDINLLSHSTQSSNEDGGSSERKISEGDQKDTCTMTEDLLSAPGTLELSDTGTSFSFKMDSSLSPKVPTNDNSRLHSLQQSLTSNDDGDGHLSCQLNLTLAYTPLQVNGNPTLDKGHQLDLDQEISELTESRFNTDGKESDTRVSPNNGNQAYGDTTLSPLEDASNSKQGPAAAPVRVNDLFWEQFLTERPGSSENEEASSNYKANQYEEQEERQSSRGVSRNNKNIEQLTL